mmetsp:Transcript_47819/g.119610  ORF Transcript_47819/g.119610 Transcript_47819/m.119610 type:complete len:204 (-) Transcript_47819:1006-1617(-)
MALRPLRHHRSATRGMRAVCALAGRRMALDCGVRHRGKGQVWVGQVRSRRCPCRCHRLAGRGRSLRSRRQGQISLVRLLTMKCRSPSQQQLLLPLLQLEGVRVSPTVCLCQWTSRRWVPPRPPCPCRCPSRCPCPCRCRPRPRRHPASRCKTKTTHSRWRPCPYLCPCRTNRRSSRPGDRLPPLQQRLLLLARPCLVLLESMP